MLKNKIKAVADVSTSLALHRRAAMPALKNGRAVFAAHRVSRSLVGEPVYSRRRYATEVHAPQAGPSTIPDISMKDTYDIVIIGGGNAGLALACALRKLRHGWSEADK